MTDRKPSSRKRIADAAREEFTRCGFAGARVARIAGEAGVNKQLIFYYFGSKAGLYEAVCASIVDAVDTYTPPAATAGPATEQLKAAVARLYTSLSERPELVSLLYDSGRGPSASRSARRIMTQLARDLKEVVSRGQGLGYFRDDADPELAAQQAVVLCAGYLGLDRERTQDPTNPAMHERWPTAVAELLARGLAW